MKKAWERQSNPPGIWVTRIKQKKARTIHIGSMLYQLFPPPKIFTLSAARDRLNQALSENQSAHVGFNRYTGSPIKELSYDSLHGTLDYLWTHGLTERRPYLQNQFSLHTLFYKLFKGTKGARSRYSFSKEYGGFLEEGLSLEYKFLEESRPTMEQFVQLAGIRI